MKKFWRIEAKAEDTKAPADLYIYDIIGQDFWTGEGVTAKAFLEDIKAVAGRDLVLHINSGGGDVFEGIAILGALDQHQGAKTVVVESLAASMASVIAMAADKGRLQIARNAFVMIHNPRGSCRGEAADMERYAGLLRSLKANLLAAYRRHSALSEEELAKAMDAETWYTAEEAKAAGLADEIVGDLQVAACLDGRALGGEKVPEAVRALFAPPLPDPEQALAEARAELANANKLVEDLQDKLRTVEAEAQGKVEAAQAEVARAQETAKARSQEATAAEAKAEKAQAEKASAVAAAQDEAKKASAKLSTLTGGLNAPVQSTARPGTASTPASAFRAAVAAVQAEHPDWDGKRCWVEAKERNPDLWAKARQG